MAHIFTQHLRKVFKWMCLCYVQPLEAWSSPRCHMQLLWYMLSLSMFSHIRGFFNVMHSSNVVSVATVEATEHAQWAVHEAPLTCRTTFTQPYYFLLLQCTHCSFRKFSILHIFSIDWWFSGMQLLHTARVIFIQQLLHRKHTVSPLQRQIHECYSGKQTGNGVPPIMSQNFQ
jgi:hypothetical protein